MSDILMPALSPTMESGTLARWLVKAGDRIEPGQVIAEIETDKATMEVEAVDEGVIEAILVNAGSADVPVNAPIARLSTGDAAPALAPPAAPAPVAAAPQPAPQSPPPVAAAPPPSPGSDRIKASPLARRLARAAAFDLVKVAGTGPHGRILARDIEQAAGLVAPPAPPAPASARAPAALVETPRPSLEQLGIAPGSYDLVPLDGMRRTIARRMSDSFRDIPHFPLSVDIELDAFIALREQLNAILAADGIKASLNDMLVKAAAVALRRVPAANASYTPDGIAIHHHADIAVAVAIDGGLITPIIRKAEAKGVGEIAAEARGLIERARAKSLAPGEFQGGTFTVSNLGMFGIKSFSSILNEPQGAILSIGAGEQRPVVKDGALAIATVMTITLTCDHRAMDGATAAKWVKTFKDVVERPMGLLL